MITEYDTQIVVDFFSRFLNELLVADLAEDYFRPERFSMPQFCSLGRDMVSEAVKGRSLTDSQSQRLEVTLMFSSSFLGSCCLFNDHTIPSAKSLLKERLAGLPLEREKLADRLVSQALLGIASESHPAFWSGATRFGTLFWAELRLSLDLVKPKKVVIDPQMQSLVRGRWSELESHLARQIFGELATGDDAELPVIEEMGIRKHLLMTTACALRAIREKRMGTADFDQGMRRAAAKQDKRRRKAKQESKKRNRQNKKKRGK